MLSFVLGYIHSDLQNVEKPGTPLSFFESIKNKSHAFAIF